jgi:DNA-binding transcriptional LysR family regulator
MELASQMILFANVVDHGSFSATARSLGLTPSSVSRQIGHLESRLGVRLLQRSTRKVSLTEEGHSLYERCAEIAHEVEETEALARSLSGRPQGTLRIATTVAFGKAQLLPVLSPFLERYPELHVALDLTDRRVDLTEARHDIAIRFSEQIEDATMMARKLATNDRVVCAAPAYIEAHGAPNTPAELAEHNCLRVSTVDGWNDWHFGGGTNEVSFRAEGNFEANSSDGVYHAALAGIGIARLSTYLVGPDLRSGRLVRLMPDHSAEKADIFAVYPSRHNLSPKIRAFIDHLVQCFQPVPPWERPA